MVISVSINAKAYGGYPHSNFELSLTKKNNEFGDDEICIKFNFNKETRNDYNGQYGGEMRIPANVARWLGEKLLVASQDEILTYTKSVSVINDTAKETR